MAKLNALSSVTCPSVLTWMHYGESEWCFYTFDCSMANLNAHYEFLAAVMVILNDCFSFLAALWRFWMTILHFWLPYGDFEWLVWIFGCPIAKLNELFILLHALSAKLDGKTYNIVKIKKFSNGFCLHRVLWILKALWNILSETINILRKLKKLTFRDAPQNVTICVCT